MHTYNPNRLCVLLQNKLPAFATIFSLALLCTATMPDALAQTSASPKAKSKTKKQAKPKAAEQRSISDVTMQHYQQKLALYQSNPNDTQIALDFAGAAIKIGQPQLAIGVYERLLDQNPNSPELLQQLAVFHQKLNNPEKAEYYRQRYQALARGEQYAPPQQGQKLQVSGKAYGGVLYDTNANQGPASDRMSLGNFQDVTVTGAQEKSTLGAYVGGAFDFAYRPEGSTNWQTVGDAKFHLRGNSKSELGDSDNRYTQWGRVAAGGRYMDNQNLVDLRLKAEIFDYEFNTNVTAIGPEITYLRAVNPNLHLITNAGMDIRDYNGNNNGRDGNYYTVGQYARIFFGEPVANKRHEFSFGARYLNGSADDNRYSYDGWEGIARVNIKLPHNVDLAPFVGYTRESYDGPATVLETSNRKDNRLTTGLTVTWGFTKDWNLEAGYQYTRNSSRSELYDYDRHVVNVGVSRNFW